MTAAIVEEYTAVLTSKVENLPVRDTWRDQVALGRIIDAGQRHRVHGLVTASVDSGATVRTGGTYEGLSTGRPCSATCPWAPRPTRRRSSALSHR